jgi:uncharacterized membrane protein
MKLRLSFYMMGIKRRSYVLPSLIFGVGFFNALHAFSFLLEIPFLVFTNCYLLSRLSSHLELTKSSGTRLQPSRN